MKLLKEEKQTKGKVYKVNNVLSDLDETFFEDEDNSEELTEDVNGDTLEISAGQIEKVLDKALKAAKQANGHGYSDTPNVLFIGPAGCGKTSRTIAWAKNRGINLVAVDAKTMDDTDLGGAIAPDKDNGTVKRYSTTEFDQLDEPNSVLFLDELNRAPSSIRGTLLSLIQDHTITDTRVQGRSRRFKGFLFTIACINPSNADYDVDQLDAAMRDRFIEVEVTEDPSVTRDYLMKYFDKEIQRDKAAGDEEAAKEDLGRQKIADTLLSSPDFSFDYNSDSGVDSKAFSSRSLKKLLLFCDGTKKDFLDCWDQCCNKEKKEMAIQILKNYNDKQDKANDALFKNKSDSELFKQKKSISQSILDSIS